MAIDPTLLTDPSSLTPDTGIPTTPDFFNDPSLGVPLSGDTYAPISSGSTLADPTQGADLSTSPLPFIPQQQPQQNGIIGMNIKDVLGTQKGPNSSFIGRNIKDVQRDLMPQSAGTAPAGYQHPKYGNDVFGNVLTGEENLPGGPGTEAFVHGAQSQIIPGITGLGGGIAAGAALGSIFPGVGTAIGAVAGGLIGYWIGSQAQDYASKQLVDQQTQDAYQKQSAYEQQNFPLQYGAGELAPQFLAFKPNPKAIIGAFRLAGEIRSAPMAEKLAVIRGPQLGEDASLADRLAYQEHQDSLNQLIMMGFGAGYTGYQAQQEIAAGNVSPILLATNLIGTTLFSKPRWIKSIAPELQTGIEEAHGAATQAYSEGLAAHGPEEIGQARAQAFQALNDAINSGDQQRISEAQATWDRLQQETPEQEQATPEILQQAQGQYDAVVEELKNEVDNARPEDKLKIAQQVDAIAQRNNIPNWQSQVDRVNAEEQARTGTLEQQTNAIRQGVEQYQAAPYERAPVVTGPEGLQGLQRAVDKFQLKPPTPPSPEEQLAQGTARRLTPEEAQASIERSKTGTQEVVKARGMLPKTTPEEVLARAAEIPEQTRQMLRAGQTPLAEDRVANESQLNVPAINHILSEATTKTGKVGAGLDPSLIPTLGKNMYSGDIGMVAVKEGLQNALDSLRGVEGQAKRIHIALSDQGFTMTDSGKGMLPAVMQKELVDIGGSTKEAGEAGGWGLAKVALFSNAQKILVRSVAVDAKGQKIDSLLRGSGADWATGNLEFGSAPTTPETPTGTTMALEWNPGVRASAYNAHDWMNRALTFNNLPDVHLSVDSPHGHLSSANFGLVSSRYTKLSTVSAIGAKLDIFASPTYDESRYGSYRAEILNNGVYQFTLPIDVTKGIDLPSHLVIDVHATGSPKQDDYPWETNRQSLRPQLAEQVKQYVQKTLVADAAKKMEAEIKDALYKAPKFEGSNFRVVDLAGNLEPHVVQAIAASKPLLGFVKQASREFGAFKGGTDKGPEFFGVSLSQRHLGVNIHASAGGPTRTRNYVLINPFITFDEVSRGVEIPREREIEARSSYRGMDLGTYNPRTEMFEGEVPQENMRVPALWVPKVTEEWLGNVLRTEIGGRGEFDWNPSTDTFVDTKNAEPTPGWFLDDVIQYLKQAHGYDATANEIRHAANKAFGYEGAGSAIDDQGAQEEANQNWSRLAKQFATQVSATLIHEYSHEQSRGHEEDFSSVLTRNIGKYLDDTYSYAKRITRFLTENNYEGIKEIERLNREYDLSRRMGANEIFRNISTGSTAKPERAAGQGTLGTGTEGGERPVQPLQSSAVREAPGVAPGTGLGGSESQPTQEGQWIKIPVSEKVAQELRIGQEERFYPREEAPSGDPYYGSLRIAGTQGRKVLLEVRPDQLRDVISNIRDDYHPETGFETQAAKARAPFMRRLADQLEKIQGERNGIQQEAAGIGQETGQNISPGQAIQASQASIPGEVGSKATGQTAEQTAGQISGIQTGNEGITPNVATAANAEPGSSTGGNGGAEAGAVPPSTIGAGIVRPNAGNESGTGASTTAAGTNANATANNAAAAGTGANAATSRGGEAVTGATQRENAAGSITSGGGGINPTATNPLTVKAFADRLRVKLAIPGYVATPEEQSLLKVLDAKSSDLARLSNPKPWPVADPRFANAVDKGLLNRTFKAVTQTVPQENEGGRAYAERVVKTTGVYPTLDHALGVAKAARDGFYEVVPTPDGKAGFKIDGKVFKDSPNFHVSNWDKDFHGVVHSILDNVPNETLAAEPNAQSPIAISGEQLHQSFADTYQPSTRPVLLAEEKVNPPNMQPHDFMQSPHAAETPSSELTPESAANKIKAGLTKAQENLDAAEQLKDTNPFDPEPVKKEFERLVGEQAENGEHTMPPATPSNGGNGNEPTPGGLKGLSPEERKAAAKEARIAQTVKLENNYVDSLKKALLVDNPLQKSIHAGINDILASALRTFDIEKWQMSPQQWVVQASRDAKAFAMRYQYLSKDISTRMKELETLSPGAEKRIRDYSSADDASRPGLLEQMSADESALAGHLHNYWQLLGDLLDRAGVIKSALEDYFPLIADRNVFRTGEDYNKGNVVAHGGKLYQAKTDVKAAQRSPEFDKDSWAIRSTQNRLAGKTSHAIARLRDTDGSLLFKTPEELQQWADDAGLGWKVRTDIGSIFSAQGTSVIKSLLMRHATDQLMNNEFEINKYGETAPAIISRAKMNNHIVALDNSDNYVPASRVIGPWQTALQRTKWMGNQRVPDDLMVWKPLVDQMEREASFSELGDNPIVRLSRFLSSVNNYFKVFKFAFTPMHAYSMLGNVSTHSGWAGTYGVVRRGAELTNNPAYRSRFFQLMRASGATEPIGEALSGPHSVLNNIPGIGNFFKLQEHLMWKTIGYNSLYGLGDKLSNEFMAKWAVEHPDEPITQLDADKFGMDAAKKALGYLDNLDMSKNWNLGSNVLLLASRWTTGQLRTMGEAFGIKPLARIGSPIALEGSSARATKFMQDRQIVMSRRLIMGGMLRLFMVGTALSTTVSALLNNGIPSTPWDNFQKDPTHTFDIYAGRDPQSNRDRWIHMPFYLFQREMLDWAMSAVKAQQQGKDFVDVSNLGDSVLAAPFARFANKMNPVTKTGFEVATGQELGQWMKGYSASGIDSDKYIVNLNKSLQNMGIPDGGSLENRLLYAFRNLSPGLNYPVDLNKATSDPWAVATAIAGLPVGGNEVNAGLGFLGTREDVGQAYTAGPNGQMVPTWQTALARQQKDEFGQQILQIASTMGTGTPEQEQLKLQQMEGLRQQAGLTPGQVVQLILYGAGHSTGGQGLLYQALPPKSPEQLQTAATVINGRTLSQSEESQYSSVKFQQEAFAISQIMGDPQWKHWDLTQRAAAVNSAKSFSDRIVNEQFSISLGTKKGNIVSTPQASAMLTTYTRLSRQANAMVQTTPGFKLASPTDQKAMLADRGSSAETAVWDKYFGVGILKNASDADLMNYVDVHSTARDEVRTITEQLASYKQGMPTSQQAMLAAGLKFADTLVDVATQGKTMKTFDSPLNRQQIMTAVRNGVVLQDSALNQLHMSYIYQEANAADQQSLDNKYLALAHNIALADMRQGITSAPGTRTGFDVVLRTTLAADEAYNGLVEQYFGTGGMVTLKHQEAELIDLKARFRQENAIPPSQLSRYDTLINRWYEQQHPEYAAFLRQRTWWERNTPEGQAYLASTQSNLGFEALDPLAL